MIPELRRDSWKQTKRPRAAFGDTSDWRTGTVLLMKPMPSPETMRAAIIGPDEETAA